MILILGLIVRMLIVGLVIYIIWDREGIDALHSLGERIPPVIIIAGLVAVPAIVVGVAIRVIGVIFQMKTKVILVLVGVLVGLGLFRVCSLEKPHPRASDWVGRWDSSIYVVDEDMFKQLYSEEFGQEVEVNLSTAYEFNSDGTFEQETSKVVRGKGLSLSGSIIIRGTYTLAGDSYLIEIGGLENIEVTGFIPEENIIELANMTRNGTWVRDGGRLTLTDDDASIVEVLKKE